MPLPTAMPRIVGRNHFLPRNIGPLSRSAIHVNNRIMTVKTPCSKCWKPSSAPANSSSHQRPELKAKSSIAIAMTVNGSYEPTHESKIAANGVKSIRRAERQRAWTGDAYQTQQDMREIAKIVAMKWKTTQDRVVVKPNSLKRISPTGLSDIN